MARERVPRETCILKRKTFEIRTIVVRLREKDGKPAVPACPHARAAGPQQRRQSPGVHTTLCRELSAVPSGLSLCRAQSVTLLVAPEALIGVPCLLCARESGAQLCLMMARHQEPRDGTVATNFGIPDESRLRLTAPSRSSTPTSLDVVGLDDSTRPAVAAAAKFRALIREPGTRPRPWPLRPLRCRSSRPS